MWFFGAYQPALTNYKRQWTPVRRRTLRPSTATSRISRSSITANQTSPDQQQHPTCVAFNNSWAKTEGLLAT
jgi:hypothetical protein